MPAAHAARENSSVPVIHGLGAHLRNLASSGEAGLFLSDDTVLRASHHEPAEPLPIFDGVLEETCAPRGIAQVIQFPQRS